MQTNLLCRKLALAVVAAFAVLTAARGATVTLDTADAGTGAATSFNSAGGWSSGAAPEAGNDYVVALGDAAGQGMWLPNVSATFAGDSLAIGTDDAAGRVDFPGNGQGITWTGAVWTRGLLHAGVLSKNVTFAGVVNVQSTAADPFVLEGESGTLTLNTSTFGITGNSDAVLVIRSTGTARDFTVTGSSWASVYFNGYNGQLIIDNANFKIASFGYGSEFRPDAIVLRNRGALVCHASWPRWNSPNVGVTVEPSGGVIYSTYDGVHNSFKFRGGPLTISAPMNFYGSLQLSELTTTANALTFCSSATLSVTNFHVAGGEVRFEPGVTCLNATPFPIAVTNNALLRVENVPTDKMNVGLCGGKIYTSTGTGVLTNLAYTSGSVYVRYDAASDTADCLTLRGTITGISAQNPLRITSHEWPAEATANRSYRLLAVPVADLPITGEMIDVSAILFDDRTIKIDMEIVEENGIRYVTVSQAETDHIHLLSGDTGFAATTAFNGNGAQWSDGQAPRDGYVYDVKLGDSSGTALRAPNIDATFAGSLLVIGDAQSAGRLEFGASNTYTLGRANFVNGSLVVTNNSNAALRGRVTIKSGASAPFGIQGDNGNLNIGDSVLVGDADSMIIVRGTGAARAFGVTAGASWGNNGYAAFAGRVIIDGAYSVHGNLATAHTTFTPDAFTLMNGGALTVTAAGPTWSGNAGVTVDETGGILNANYRSTLQARVPFQGGPLSVHVTSLFYNALALSNFTVSATVKLQPGVKLANEKYTLKSGELWFNTGAVFQHENRVPLEVTGGTLYADAAAMEHLTLSLTNATFVTRNDAGSLYETYELANATLGGGTITFDSSTNSAACDTLVFTGDTGIGFSPAAPLKLKLSSPVPYAKRYDYELMVFPAGTRKLRNEDFDISGIAFDQPETDGQYAIGTRIVTDGAGCQHVYVARLSTTPGTVLTVR